MAEIRIHFDVRLSPLGQAGAMALLLLLSSASELGSESVDLTTYYPSPAGIYAQLTTQGTTYLAKNSVASRVGIGTAGPTAKLEVTDNDALDHIGIQTGGSGDLVLGNGAGLYMTENSYPAKAAYLGPSAGRSTQSFYTNNVERMRLTSGGKALIRTTSPSTANVLLGVGNGSTRAAIMSRQDNCYVRFSGACAATEYSAIQGGFRSSITTSLYTADPPALGQSIICCSCGGGC